MQECFARADQIAREQLDKLAVQFQAGEPTFYSEYTAARRIGDTSSRKDKPGAATDTITLPKAA